MIIHIEVRRTPELSRWLGRMESGVNKYLLYPALEGLRVKITRHFSQTIGPESNRTTSSGGLWRGLHSDIHPRGRNKAELVFTQSQAYSRDVIRGKRRTSSKPSLSVYLWASKRLGKPKTASWRVARAVARRRYFKSFESKIPYGVGVWDYPREVIIRSEGDLRDAANAIGRLVIEMGR